MTLRAGAALSKKAADRFLTLREVLVAGSASLSARPELGRPHTQGAMRSGEFEVVVGAQEGQIVSNTQLSEERVDRTDLDACSAALIAESGG